MNDKSDEFDEFAAECGGDEVPRWASVLVLALTMVVSTLIAYVILSLL